MLPNLKKYNTFFHCECYITLHNPFAPNAPLLYPLKISENLTVFWCFQGVEKGCIGNKWVTCQGGITYTFVFPIFVSPLNICICKNLKWCLPRKKFWGTKKWCGNICTSYLLQYESFRIKVLKVNIPQLNQFTTNFLLLI